MKRYCISVALAMAVMTLPLAAQKRKGAVSPKQAKTTAAAKQDKELEQKIAQMEAATQKIMFIDSVVVDKANFLQHYLLNPETGMVGRYSDLIHVDEQPHSYAYVNELGDKCYYSFEDTVGSKLYSSDILDGKISNASPLKGVDTKNVFTEANYPFMMADGVTFYFAAKGKESIGGYDIFVTRFDSEKGTFLKPENIGMPFNSTANDYMYVIDEYGNLGWFATDRGQKNGKVCVYTFVPADTREVYSADGYTPEQIHGFAHLNSIAATWGNGKERKAAMERLAAIPQRLREKSNKNELAFVINDEVTYRKLSDFKVKENMSKYKQLLEQRQRLDALDASIAKARDFYAKASAKDKKAITNELLQSEQQRDIYEANLMKLEKDIRNSENQALSKR